MKNLLLLVLALALVLAAVMVLREPSRPTTGSGKVLEDFKPEETAEITIKSGEGSVTLRSTPEGWTVSDRNAYPADQERISSLLMEAWDLKGIQSQTVGASQLGRLQLAAPAPETPATESAVSVEFKNAAGETLETLFLGKNQMQDGPPGMPGMAGGRYVRSSDSGETVFLTESTFANAVPAPAGWLKNDLPKIQDPVIVESQSPSESWKIERPEGDWVFVGGKKGEKPDMSKLVGLFGTWAQPTFVDVTEENPSHGLDKARTVTFTEKDGRKLVLKIGNPDAGNIPMKVEVVPAPPKEGESQPTADPRWQNRVFLVSSSLLDSIPVSRKDLLPPPPSPTPTPSPAKSTNKQLR